MNSKFAKSAYTNFLLWGVCSSLGMTVSTLVDALLVGNIIGSDGLAVANIATPVFLSYALLGITVGVGANVTIGRLLGASEITEANRVFRCQLTAGLIIGALCLIPPLFFRDAFLRFLGVTTELYPLAKQYLTVVLCSAPIFVIYHILSASVRTDSDPRLAAAASAVVIIANLTLDVLFMAVLKMGILGASASLCIAEALGTAVLLIHFLRKRSLLRLGLSKPVFPDLTGFAANGFGIGSAYIFQAAVMLIFNTLLIRTGGDNGVLYVAVFGVIYTVSMIPFAVFDGSSNSLSTVSSFFVGERDNGSILTVFRLGLLTAAAFGVVLAALCAVFSGELAHFFGLADVSEFTAASPALRIFSVSIVFTGINTLVTAYWQAIGRAKAAGFFSVLRNFLCMLFFGLLLIPRFQINGLAMTYVCSEAVCSLVIVIFSVFSPSRSYLEKNYSFSGRSFENNYIIHTESMEQISADLERIFDEWEVGPKQAFLINLIVEELLLNIIKFALKENGKTRYIAIRLMEQDGEYAIRIRDNVNTYNPFESSGDAIDDGVLKLITKKTKYYTYQRKLIFNYLYMVV